VEELPLEQDQHQEEIKVFIKLLGKHLLLLETGDWSMFLS
jgi:hypothetical protein